MRHAKMFVRVVFSSTLAVIAAMSWQVASAQTAVSKAMRLQLGANDLTHISRAIGNEIAHNEITGRVPLSYGTLSFSQFEARDIKFKATVKGLETAARDGYLLSDVYLSQLEIRIGSLTFAAAPRARCRGFQISFAGTQPLQARLQVIPDREKVRIHANRAIFQVPGHQFRSNYPADCNTVWQTSTLVSAIGTWAADLLKNDILEHVVAELNSSIDGHLSQAGNGLITTILLPWQANGQQSVVASTDIHPRHALIRRPRLNYAPLTVDLASVISVRSAPHPGAGQYKPRKDQAPNVPRNTASWFGVSRSYLAGVIRESYRQNLLSVAINKHTTPQLRDVLHARELARFVPDAANRFVGHEDVELRLGKAHSVSVIIKPQGPGGIPIIDAYLSKVPLEVYVDGKSYVQANTDVHFRYTARIDEEAGVLIFDLEDTDSKTGRVGFNPVLFPVPSNQSVRTGAFNQWIDGFATNKSFGNNGIEAITISLPSVTLGSQHIEWHHTLKIIGDYLTTGFTLR